MTRYRTIVADPPWPLASKAIGISKKLNRRNATVIPYEFMGVDEIAALDVGTLAADAAHLYLWTTRKLFREGEAAKVARAWGFEPCGEIIWGLRNPGLGGFNGSGHEPVLVARRGGASFPMQPPAAVMFWRQLYLNGKEHSAKPEAFLDWVESVSPGPYLEIFARRARFGWDYAGDGSLGTVDIPGLRVPGEKEAA